MIAMFMFAEADEKSEEILDDLNAEHRLIEEEKKQIKKIEAKLEEMSDQFQNLENESDLFKGQLSENLPRLFWIRFLLEFLSVFRLLSHALFPFRTTYILP